MVSARVFVFSRGSVFGYTIPAYLALPPWRPTIYYANPETYKIVENALKIMLGSSTVCAVGSQSEQIETGHPGGQRSVLGFIRIVRWSL